MEPQTPEYLLRGFTVPIWVRCRNMLGHLYWRDAWANGNDSYVYDGGCTQWQFWPSTVFAPRDPNRRNADDMPDANWVPTE